MLRDGSQVARGAEAPGDCSPRPPTNLISYLLHQIPTVGAIKIVDFREPQSDFGMRPRAVSNWRPITEIVVLCAPDNYRRDRLVSTENLD